MFKSDMSYFKAEISLLKTNNDRDVLRFQKQMKTSKRDKNDSFKQAYTHLYILIYISSVYVYVTKLLLNGSTDFD